MPKSSTRTRSRSSAFMRIRKMLAGFEIAMDDARVVRRAQRRRHVAQDRQRARQLHRPLLLDDLRQRRAVEQLHDDEAFARLGRPVVEHLHDVGVADLRRRARLDAEALDHRLLVGVLAPHDLDRHAPPELEVLGLVHAPHAAFAEPPQDAVAPGEQRSFGVWRLFVLGRMRALNGRGVAGARARRRIEVPHDRATLSRY